MIGFVVIEGAGLRRVPFGEGPAPAIAATTATTASAAERQHTLRDYAMRLNLESRLAQRVLEQVQEPAWVLCLPVARS